MYLEDVINKLNKIRSASDEAYMAEANRVLVAFSETRWNNAVAATVRVLQNGGTVSGFSCKLQRARESKTGS